MNPNDKAKLEKEIFERAVEMSSLEARDRHLMAACRGDAELLARLQTLLRAHEDSSGFFAGDPAGEPTAKYTSVSESDRSGTVIARYKLLQKIGEGGCGTVYMAEQEEP